MDIQAWIQKSTAGSVGVMEKRMSGRNIGRDMEREKREGWKCDEGKRVERGVGNMEGRGVT